MKNNTGAKVAQKGAAFLVAFALGLNAGPMIAQASVHPTNVVVVEDESKIKGQREGDVKAVREFVAGFDMTTIARAMELSDYLNVFDPEMYTYTNATPREILNLDINGMYSSYQNAQSNPDLTSGFIAAGLEEKPALDAAIQFSTGTVSRTIKNRIANLFTTVASKDELTGEPQLFVNGDEILVAVPTIYGTRVFQVQGYALPGVVETVNELDTRYRMITRNLRGDSNNYPNGLSFNGLEQNTGESVWLSIGDSDIKEVISRGLQIARSLYEDPTLRIDWEFGNYDPLSEQELEFLSKKGIDVNSLESFDKTYAYMTTELDQTLNMR